MTEARNCPDCGLRLFPMSRPKTATSVTAFDFCADCEREFNHRIESDDPEAGQEFFVSIWLARDDINVESLSEVRSLVPQAQEWSLEELEERMSEGERLKLGGFPYEKAAELQAAAKLCRAEII